MAKYRDLLRALHDDGWRNERTRGSHLMYVHLTKRPAGCAQQHPETGGPQMTQTSSQGNAYAYVIERAADGSYWAYLPDLPGCATTGDSPEQVERQLHEAVDLYLSHYRDRGLPPPTPQARVGTLTEA